jgi:hypothetical protein
LNGVNIDSYPDAPPSLWEPLSQGTFRVKDEGTTPPLPTFDAFVVYIPTTCSTFGSGTLRERALTALEARESMGVEQGLAAGILGVANPYLSDSNLDILGSGTISPEIGLAYLEEAIGGTGQQGMIHATPAVVSRLYPWLTEADGGLVTANGNKVVSGAGYQGIVPDGEGNPGAGEDYIYATGPVEVRLGPVVITELAESMDRELNTVTFRAERYALATWDTVLQAAVLVDWTACCGVTP